MIVYKEKIFCLLNFNFRKKLGQNFNFKLFAQREALFLIILFYGNDATLHNAHAPNVTFDRLLSVIMEVM